MENVACFVEPVLLNIRKEILSLIIIKPLKFTISPKLFVTSQIICKKHAKVRKSIHKN